MNQSDIKLSLEFKAQTTRAIIAIAFFAFTYLLLLLLALCLTALCIYGGIMLIVSFPRFITLALGIGLASMGIFILIFLLKFIFTSNKADRTHLHEITRAEEPELFRIIDELVHEIGTTFPKNVYLSVDVNACVFYDSNFWSMFLPVKKNLQIGMGLVNSVTKAELKAILAHEFGHFSQKTMKVGSHVYNVNQVIFNMLYENDSYQKMIHSWANMSSYFSIFVGIAIKINQGLQWILRRMYEIVNKSYMGLSREMEFHADEVASCVTGYEPLKSSLQRIPFSDHAFNSVLTFYDGKIEQNYKSENVYREQSFVMNFLASYNNFAMKHELPDVSHEDLNKFNKSKLVIKNQWASHPSTDERVARMEQRNHLSVQIENSPANEIFSNIDQTQKELTKKIFERVNYNGEAMAMAFEEFVSGYREDFMSGTFSKIYNGYYDHKNPEPFELNTNISASIDNSIEELFSDQKVDWVYTAIALKNDREELKQMSAGILKVKSFDYDGQKFKGNQSIALVSTLDTELEQTNEHIKQNDRQIFEYFRRLEMKLHNAPQLEQLYRDFFDFDMAYEDKYELYAQLSNELQFVNHNTTYELILSNFEKISALEIQLKERLAEMLQQEMYCKEMKPDMKSNIELYLSQKLSYFTEDKYIEKNLEVLFSAINNYAYLLAKGYFILKSKLLHYQEELHLKVLQPMPVGISEEQVS